MACHLLDVGNACLALWNKSMGDELRARWARCLSLDEQTAGRWIAFWAATHDIGKISPGFQFKSPSAKQQLKALGFAISSSPVLPHARLSAVYLQDELSDPRNGAWPAVSKKMAACVAAVVGGHHGVIPGAGELRNCRNSLGQGAWVEARSRVMTLIADEFSVAGSVPPCELIPEAGGFWLFLAGLISVADWVGSNAKFFQANGRWAGADVDWDEYRQLSQQRADDAVRQLGFGRWSPRKTGPLSFTDVHPEIQSPRPLQKCCVEIVSHTTKPQLVLIEAPMGEGKTEAAVYLADHSSHVLGGRGLYIALPTQATSNQMFSRIEKWLRQRYQFEDETQRINLQLLHGRTGFSEAFSELLKIAEIDTTETRLHHAIW
ncbi:MAG: CRISPR-associated endonuclease Cas3'' [Planctomycetaceae bacterium]